MATGQLTILGSNLFLDHLFRGNQLAQFSPYLAAFLTNPSQQGPGSEPSGGGYSRLALQSSNFSTPSAATVTNVTDLIFDRSTGWQGNVVGLGLFDSSVSGRCFAFWNAQDVELIQSGDRLVVLSGGLTHQFLTTGYWSLLLQNGILDHLYKGIPLPLYPSMYLATYTSAPTQTAGGTEPSTGGYIRQAVNINGVSFAAPAANTINSALPYQFPLATAAQGTQAFWGLHDNQSGGNYLLGGALNPTKDIQINDQLEFIAGSLTIQLDATTS